MNVAAPEILTPRGCREIFLGSMAKTSSASGITSPQLAIEMERTMIRFSASPLRVTRNLSAPVSTFSTTKFDVSGPNHEKPSRAPGRSKRPSPLHTRAALERCACWRLSSQVAPRLTGWGKSSGRCFWTSASGGRGAGNSSLGAPNASESSPSTGAGVQAAADASSSPIAEAATQAQPVMDAVPAMVELGWWPSDVAMRLVDGVSATTGWPYWMSIAALTMALRGALLPLGLTTQRNAIRMNLMRPEMDLLTKAMESDKNPNQQKKAERFRAELRALFKKHNCGIGRAFIFPAIQIPMMVTFFAGLRQMSEVFPSYATGGALWFQDLGAPDPFMVLPIATSASLLLMSEMGADGMISSSFSSQMRIAMRVIPVIMVPMTMNFSAGVFVYFATSNAFSILQTSLLKVPRVRKALRIPTMPPPAQPSSDKSEITWIDVLAARNPVKAYAEMRRAREANPLLGGSSGAHSASRPGAPLPPPPPLVTSNAHGELLKGIGEPKSTNKPGAEPTVVLHTSRPRKAGSERETATAQEGAKKKKRRGRHGA